MSGTAAVFLDRDGVLNEPAVRDGLPYPPGSAGDVVLTGGALEACTTLAGLDIPLICVTNQPDIARGTVTEAEVSKINAGLQEKLGLLAVMVCPHDDADGCPCRKPKPGMIIEAAERHDIDLTRSVMVGDRWRDIEAGVAAGCRTVFIDRHYREKQPVEYDYKAPALVEAVPWIVEFIAGSGIQLRERRNG